MRDPSFVHLDVRSCFSLKEGAFTPEQLAARAPPSSGCGAVAMTDRDGLYGAARFVAGVRERGRARRSWAPRSPCGRRAPPPGDAHVVLLALDDAGYANLCRLLTDAHMLGERGDPWVDPEQICAHAAGLVAIAGPRSHPGRAAVAGRVDARRAAARPVPRGVRARAAVRRRRAPASSAAPPTRPARCCASPSGPASRAVATNPVRYLEPGDAFVADALECMRRIVPVADTNVTRRNAEGWLKPAAEMRALFVERPDLVRRDARGRRACARSTWGWTGSTSRTSRRRRAAAPTPCSPSAAGAASTNARCARTSACANGCTTSSR